MSQRALLLACQDILQAAPNQTPPALSGLGLPAAQCGVMFDEQPPPGCGELFVSIHPGDWSADDVEGLKESYDLEITVTVRMAVIPRDRQSNVCVLASLGGKTLDAQLEAIRALLHLDSVQDQWLNRANFYIGGSASGFVEPPRFRGCSRPKPCGPDWFSADSDGKERLPPVGLAQTLKFAGAVRLQRIETED